MINKKIASEIAVGIILLVTVVVAGIFLLRNESISKIQNTKESEIVVQKPTQKDAVMCTQDAKLCEDGKTYVSRTGPNCEFSLCPSLGKESNLINVPVGKFSVSSQNIISTPIIKNEIDETDFFEDNKLSSDKFVITFSDGEISIMTRDSIDKIIKGIYLSAQFSGFIVPMHPENKDIVFFSSVTFLDELKKCENKIYSYNVRSGDMIEIYSEIDVGNASWKNKGSGNCRKLETAGVQGSKLIMMPIDADSSPGPCVDYWGNYNFFYLELSDIKAGLKKFIVPEAQLVKSEKEADMCYNSL